METKQAYQRVVDCGITAVARGDFAPDTAKQVVDVLTEEGITVFELTTNSTEPFAALEALKGAYGDDVLVGMGTVLSVDDARRALNAGADFIVSPAFQRDVVAFVKGKGYLVAPGVATPTEAVEAWEMGVSLLKLFPIGALGLDYFKALFGPLNHMRFMCNGGLTDQNAREFITAGAVAVGMGSWLTGDGTWTPSRLRSRARLLRTTVDSARTGQPPTREV